VSQAGEAGATWRWRFEDVEFDESRMALIVGGVQATVEPKPLQLLAELLRHVNEAVTRDELFESVWAGQVTIDHVLASAVNRLRRALGPSAAARIVTLPRIGYRLNGPVERMAAGPAPVSTSTLATGQAVHLRPGFRLDRRLGGGSGGEVWLARHATLGEHRVFKLANSPEQLRAIKREYTLHRLLRAELGDIDGLAPLLDAQLTEPPFHLESPWLGPDLPRWAAEQAAWQSMGADARIELLLPVVRALAVAHAVGVLHKDIKPSNILVAGTPGAWRALLADFGSGLAQDPERLRQLGLTALGLTVTDQDAAARAGGTVLYLAPELLAGRPASVQSDIYALGLVLYQAVVGQFTRPLSGSWQDDIACELLRDDIARATAADPDRRLSSARELLDRLQSLPQRRIERHEQLQQEMARQRAASDLASRRARRPWVVGGAVSLALGLVASLGAWMHANQQRQQAEASAERALAIGHFLHRDVLESSSIIGIGKPFQATTLLDVLRKASEAAGERFRDQPQTEGEARRRLAETYILLAAFPEADADSKRAVALLEAAVPPDNEQLLLARFERARLLVWRERHAEALEQLVQAERAAGPERLQERSLLAYAAVRARSLYLAQVAEHTEFAHLSTPEMRAASVPLAQRELELADLLHASHGTDRAAARQSLAQALWVNGDRPAAERVLEELTRPPFDRPAALAEFRARYLLTQAYTARRHSRHADAMALLERSLETLQSAGSDVNEFSLAWGELEVGRERWTVGRGTEAIQTLRSAQDRFRRLLGPNHHYIAMLEREIGIALPISGRAAAALEAIQRCEDEDARNKRHNRWPAVNAVLRAMAHNDLGQGAQALALLEGVSQADAQRQSKQAAIGALMDHERGQALILLGRIEEGRALKARGREEPKAYTLGPAVARRIGAQAPTTGERPQLPRLNAPG
jgi:non-specific serine/threonine protein kinase